MLLGLAAFLAFRIKLYRATLQHTAQQGEPSPQAVTVVVCCYNEGDALERNLPKLMEQRGVEFEVVVVDECSTDDTADVLKRAEAAYPNIRHTFVPRTSRYVSRDKLAVTLGIKAAHNNIVVLTRPTCAPLTDLWLRDMAKCAGDGTDIVIGYANYADNGTLAAGRAVFERMQYSMMWMLAAKGKPIGADMANMAVKRDAFLACGGYASSLDNIFGVDDLLVWAMAKKGNAAVCASRAAIVREYSGNLRAAWRSYKLKLTASFASVPRSLSRAVIALKAANLGHFLWLAGGAIAVAELILTAHYAWTAVPLGVMLAVSVVDAVMMHGVTQRLGERSYVLLLPWYELIRPLTYPFWRLKYIIHKHDFSRKI